MWLAFVVAAWAALSGLTVVCGRVTSDGAQTSPEAMAAAESDPRNGSGSARVRFGRGGATAVIGEAWISEQFRLDGRRRRVAVDPYSLAFDVSTLGAAVPFGLQLREVGVWWRYAGPRGRAEQAVRIEGRFQVEYCAIVGCVTKQRFVLALVKDFRGGVRRWIEAVDRWPVDGRRIRR